MKKHSLTNTLKSICFIVILSPLLSSCGAVKMLQHSAQDIMWEEPYGFIKRDRPAHIAITTHDSSRSANASRDSSRTANYNGAKMQRRKKAYMPIIKPQLSALDFAPGNKECKVRKLSKPHTRAETRKKWIWIYAIAVVLILVSLPMIISAIQEICQAFNIMGQLISGFFTSLGQIR